VGQIDPTSHDKGKTVVGTEGVVKSHRHYHHHHQQQQQQ
jgi:hypothetical protein